jgi:hypothetical protein
MSEKVVAVSFEELEKQQAGRTMDQVFLRLPPSPLPTKANLEEELKRDLASMHNTKKKMVQSSTTVSSSSASKADSADMEIDTVFPLPDKNVVDAKEFFANMTNPFESAFFLECEKTLIATLKEEAPLVTHDQFFSRDPEELRSTILFVLFACCRVLNPSLYAYCRQQKEQWASIMKSYDIFNTLRATFLAHQIEKTKQLAPSIRLFTNENIVAYQIHPSAPLLVEDHCPITNRRLAVGEEVFRIALYLVVDKQQSMQMIYVYRPPNRSSTCIVDFAASLLEFSNARINTNAILKVASVEDGELLKNTQLLHFDDFILRYQPLLTSIIFRIIINRCAIQHYVALLQQ